MGKTQELNPNFSPSEQSGTFSAWNDDFERDEATSRAATGGYLPFLIGLSVYRINRMIVCVVAID